jgi:hypothetical protein
VIFRCAIYTRKSSEDGLEQEFNSLDAQREACEAYVTSQRHAGWIALPDFYDDGGLSGGTMERPALQRLLCDIRAGKVQIIVVYKVDRLTRSFADLITYKLQERLHGGLSQSILRELERLNAETEASCARKPAPPISLKPGTRLVREWRDVTHTALVRTDGFEWNGRRYRSLTIVAREITGAHWSGPRFFGLRKSAGARVETAEGEHAEA